MEAFKQALARTEEDGGDGEVEFIDQACLQVLPDGGRTAADAYVLAVGGFTSAFQRDVDALGDEMEVPTLSGKVALKIPAGTQSGVKMRLKGKGIQRLGGYGQGDQIVTVHVETPTKLSSEQKELFKRLAEVDHHSNPMSRGFFDKVKDLFQ